jgi:hypothetical protein
MYGTDWLRVDLDPTDFVKIWQLNSLASAEFELDAIQNILLILRYLGFVWKMLIK